MVDIYCGVCFGEKVLLENLWWKCLEEMPYLISLNPLLFQNIAYIGSWKHFVFVFVFVCVCVSLSFCKYSSRSLSSPDDKLSEDIWFVWSKTSYDGYKWRCYHGDDERRTISENRASQQIYHGLLSFAIPPPDKSNIAIVHC